MYCAKISTFTVPCYAFQLVNYQLAYGQVLLILEFNFPPTMIIRHGVYHAQNCEYDL